MKTDYFDKAAQQFANLMIEKIQQVEDNWQKPWITIAANTRNFFPQNLTGRRYAGGNAFLLLFLCEKFQYQTPVFMTFNQAKEAGISVLKGSKSFPVYYFLFYVYHKETRKKITFEEYKALSREQQQEYNVIPTYKYYSVFNLDQTNFSDVRPEEWEALREKFRGGQAEQPDGTTGEAHPEIDAMLEAKSWFCPVREQFETELIQAGAAETDAQKSMAIVKEYNDSIQNTSLVEEGYASFDMTMPEYDIDAIQDLWMKKNPDFIGYNCRITAFGLMKDLIMVQDMGGRNTEYLFLDEAALDAGELFTAEEREKFETVFSEIKTDASTDTKKQIGVQREYWEKAGVTFDEESKLSLITVYLHSHIDENENSLIAGHAGVLLDTGNEILFFEKISFELPYQLIRFEDRDQLKEYLMRCYDVDTTGECASPFILENDRVL